MFGRKLPYPQFITLRQLFAAVVFTFFAINQASALVEPINVSCSDIYNADTCQITNDGTYSSYWVELIDEITTAIANGEQDPEDYCSAVGDEGSNPDGTTPFQCTLNNVTHLDCNVMIVEGQATTNQASCSVPNPAGEGIPLLTLDCTEDNGSGTCSIQTSAETEDIINAAIRNVTTSSNHLTFGAALAKVCTNLNGTAALAESCFYLTNLIGDGDDDLLRELISQITPMNAIASANAAMSGLQSQNQNITQRLNNLKEKNKEDTEADVSGFRILSNGRLVSAADFWQSANIAAAAEQAEDSVSHSAADTGKLGVFLNGNLIMGENDPTDFEGENEFTTTGITTGVDYRFRDDLVGGVAFGYANTSTDFANNRGDLKATGYNLSLYGSFYKENYYVDTTFTMGGSDFEQDRIIKLSNNTLNGSLESDYFGDQIAFTAAGGMNLTFRQFYINPYAQLAYSSSTVDEHSEEASANSIGPVAGYSLTLNEQKISSLQFNLGAQTTMVFNKPWGVVIPLARLELVNELDDDEQLIVGRFTGDVIEQTQFSLPTNEVDTSYFNLGFGCSVAMVNGNSMFFYYQATLGYDNMTQNAINFGYRWEL